MNSILFTPSVWQGKQQALETYGETVTRRLDGLKEINKEPDKWLLPINYIYNVGFEFYAPDKYYHVKPRYHVGEVVYVEEAWRTDSVYDKTPPCDIGSDALIEFKALPDKLLAPIMGRWRSPLHLPARFARSFLQVTGVSAGRVHEITEGDAMKEGCWVGKPNSIAWYKALWDSCYPAYPFESNPWVFRYSLKRASKPERMK